MCSVLSYDVKEYRVIALISADIVSNLISKDASLRASVDIQTRDSIRRILSRVLISKDASLRASVDIQTRDNIRRYRCDNPFII